MFRLIAKSLKLGFLCAFFTLFLGAILAFLSAPVFFGVTLITSAIAGSVVLYTIISGILGFSIKLFTLKRKEKKDATAATAN